MKPLQERIQGLVEANIARDQDRGVQVAIYLGGKLVVDIAAGLADVRTGRPVDGDTLFPVFSTTKGIAATLIHILAERGQLEYDAPIARYWPEFGVKGKEQVTVRHALNHTAGLPQMPESVGPRDLGHWEVMCAAMTQLSPLWPPGKHQFYHAVTYSWLVGEVARRVGGSSIAKMVEKEICQPLGMSDLYIGIPEGVESRVAWLEERVEKKPAPPPAQHDATSEPAPISIAPWMNPLHEWMNRDDARRACVPASNGIMSARAVARHYAALLPGGVDGVELLPPSRVQVASELQIPEDEKDVALENLSSHRALGYHLVSLSKEKGRVPTGFGHGGYGGSLAFADPAHGLALCVTRNFFAPEGPVGFVLDEVRCELGLAPAAT